MTGEGRAKRPSTSRHLDGNTARGPVKFTLSGAIDWCLWLENERAAMNLPAHDIRALRAKLEELIP